MLFWHNSIPRTNDSNITDKKGTPNADGVYADIGAYEFTGNSFSTIDLEPINLQSPPTAVTGEKVTLQWTIRNNGSTPAAGTWTDRIVMVSDAGQVVTVADITHSGSIIAGDTQTFYAEVVVPNVGVGNWRFAVQVNVNRNIFEGTNTDNNRIDAAAWTSVDVALLTERNITITLDRQSSKLYRVDIPAGQAYYLMANSAESVSIYVSENSAPTATSHDHAATAGIGGQYALYVPASSSARTVYLLIESGNKATSVTLSAANETLALAAVTNDTPVSNKGTSTIGFIGGGFDATMTVSLRLGNTTITGTNLSVNSGSSASASFNLQGAAAGTYDLVITKGGVTKTLTGAVQVKADGIGARLTARFDVVDAVRVGRLYEGYIVFTNTGDCDILLPVFTVSSASNTPLGLTADSVLEGNTLYLLAAGSSGSAGVLRPGETGKVTFYFQGTDNTRMNFSTWVNDDSTTPFFTSDYWTNWGDFHQDLSNCLTQLEQRGYLPQDYSELMSFLTAQKAGEDTTLMFYTPVGFGQHGTVRTQRDSQWRRHGNFSKVERRE